MCAMNTTVIILYLTTFLTFKLEFCGFNVDWRLQQRMCVDSSLRRVISMQVSWSRRLTQKLRSSIPVLYTYGLPDRAWSSWCWQRTTWWIGMGESGSTRMWHRRTRWITVNNVRGSCNWSSKSVVRTPVSKQPVVSTIQPIHDVYHREWVTLKYIRNWRRKKRHFLTSTQVSSRNSSIQKRRWLTRWLALATGNDLVKRLGIKTFDVDIERTAAGRTQLSDEAIRNGVSRGYLLSRHSAPTYRAPNSDKSQRILQTDGRTVISISTARI